MLKTNTRIWNGSPFPVPNQPTPVYMQGDPDDVFDLASGLNPVFRSLVVESWGGGAGNKAGQISCLLWYKSGSHFAQSDPIWPSPTKQKSRSRFPRCGHCTFFQYLFPIAFALPGVSGPCSLLIENQSGIRHRQNCPGSVNSFSRLPQPCHHGSIPGGQTYRMRGC